MLKRIIFNLLSVGCFLSSLAFGQTVPQSFVVEGRLYDSGGLPLNNPSVNVRLEVIDADNSCSLYKELHTGVNVSATNPTAQGVFALPFGSPTTVEFAGAGITNIFTGGSGVAGSGCTSAGSNRSLVIYVDDGSGYQKLDPPTRLLSVPTAMVAQNAADSSKLGGVAASQYLKANGDLSQTNLQTIFASANDTSKLRQIIDGTSTTYLKSSPSTQVSFNSQRLTNVAAPTDGFDAANKNYADSYLGGKTLDLTGIASGIGAGSTLVWDSVASKWVAGLANAGKLQGRAVSSVTPATDQILKWNGSAWSPAADLGMTALSGDVTASGSGAVTATLNSSVVTNTKIADGSISSSKIASGYAINRLLITDGTTGSNVGYSQCGNVNQILVWTANGWQCATVSSLSPVTSVATKTGNVTLNFNDIDGLGSAATYNVGTSANNVVKLDANSSLPAVNGSQLTNVNAARLLLSSFPLTGSPGSAASPTYSFSDDPDTGWYSLGSGKLAVATDSIERLRIESSGNIGVGTTSAESKLTVHGTIQSMTGGFKFPDGTTQTTAGLTSFPLLAPNGTSSNPSYSFAGEASSGVYLKASGQLALQSAGVQGLLVAGSNLVGGNNNTFPAGLVGSMLFGSSNSIDTSLGGQLRIFGHSNGITNAQDSTSTANILGNHNNVNFRNHVFSTVTAVGSSNTINLTSDSNTTVAMGIGVTATDGQVVVGQGNNTITFTTLNSFFRGGNVGIGTTSPNAKLEISSGTAGTSGLKFTNFNSSSSTSTGQAVGVDAYGNLVTVANGGSGTVTSVSVTTANGLGGTVSTASTTPAITLTTSVNGLVKGNGTGFSAAGSSDITSALGYTPVNKTGDTMTGNLTHAAATGSVYTSGGSNGAVTILGPSNTLITSYTLRLPAAQGGASTFLQNDGNGNLSFVTPSGISPVGSTLNSAQIWVGNNSNQAAAVSLSGDATLSNAGALTIGKINSVSITADPLSQYALLGGRSGGQTLSGGNTASNNLTLDSTSNSTKGKVLIAPNGGSVGIGLSSPTAVLHVASTSGATGSNSEVARFEGIGVFRQNASGSPTALVLTNSGGPGSSLEFRGTVSGNEKPLALMTASQSGSNGTLGFHATNNGTMTRYLTLDPAGETGIGTTTMASLNMDGEIQAKAFDGPGVKTLLATFTNTNPDLYLQYDNLTNRYRYYELVFENLVPEFGQNGFFQILLATTDNQVHWGTNPGSSSYYTIYSLFSGTTSEGGKDLISGFPTNYFRLHKNVIASSNSTGLSGSVIINNPSSTTNFKMMSSKSEMIDSNLYPAAESRKSYLFNTAAVKTIAIALSADGTVGTQKKFTGTIKVYGWN